MKTFYILACLATFCFSEDTLDYCSIILCSAATHIRCKNDGQLDSTCPDNTNVIIFRPSIIEAFVEPFNKFRNELAGGKIPGFKPAARMSTMQWDDELAIMANLFAIQCTLDVSGCQYTQKFPNAGALIYNTFSNKDESDESVFTSKAKEIVEDYKDGTFVSDIGDPPVLKFDEHYDFVSKIMEINFAVVCSAVKYPINTRKLKYEGFLACCFAEFGYEGSLVYTSSDVPASGCKKKNPKYPNLCSVDEVYKLYFQKPL